MPLTLKHVTLTVAGNTLIKDLNLEVFPGSVLALMGSSGCGKSSLLSYIAGTISQAFKCRGEVWLGHTKISTLPIHKRHVGIQFQDHLLFPHMTVGENLAFGIPSGYGRKERKRRVMHALGSCDMANFSHHDPATLSGGQKARISLMRTLLSEPKALLLDEPFSKLDPNLKKSFREFVIQQITSRAVPTIMVTHDADDTLNANQVIQL
ncbi:ATP-binding cassette domain-containing protein [Endozoicomonas sp. Mp262]|uniref:ATP-binding cassette domain-containing protein n=1 Tax=Endozoicomonas sp. Mp262 TaxID=2919499 RepID=UPI0021D81195